MQLRVLRRLGYEFRRRLPRMSLSQRFFWAAVAIVAATTLTLGNWAGTYLGDSIATGVGGTAAASIEALVSRSLGNGMAGEVMTAERRAELDRAFEIGNTAAETRLLEIRVRDLHGSIRYASLSGLRDEADASRLRQAEQGRLLVEVVDLPLRSVGDLPESTIPILKIYTPVHHIDTNEILGVAELYFSARSVRALQARARSDVWIIVATIGFAAVGTLALLVDVTGNVITRHRLRLARNLQASRQLIRENLRLTAASERLRVDASLANEQVLAQVGSDIHDGPVQLLTLLILRLTRSSGNVDAAGEAAALATSAMEDLRGISAGLVLPELAKVDLAEAVLLAIARHESLTGTTVLREVNVSVDAAINAKVCAYRVVQEALNNAHRHAGGLDQTVMAVAADGWLTLQVTNRPGRGIEGPSTSPTDRIGLRAMRFRVESLGGDLVVDLNANPASVVARIPLTQPG